MHLSNDQIREIVKGRSQRKEIEAGILHQERLRFHTETTLHKNDLSPYYTEFLNWIGEEDPEILAKDKFDRFRQLIKAPIQTIELTESIYSKLFRVFHSQDSYFNYRFTDDALEADWAEFRDEAFWPTVGFRAMQTAIDSVWIAELSEIQVTEFPEPQNRLIDISDVISIENDEKNNCLYVIFKIGDWYYIYDHVMFRAWESKDGKMVGDPIEVPHDLGYTPARMMWSEKLTSMNRINKEAPITKVLTDMDWLLFHMTSKRHMDIANAYPILAMYEPDDDVNDNDITDNEQRKTNKKTAGNKIGGAGSIVLAPVPREGEQDLMSSGPMKQISPDVDTMKWHVAEEVRLSDKTYKSVVGSDQEQKNDAAKNETQIESTFESQKSVLFRVKKNFEIINAFADKTLCLLRYGERFTGCEIDYGTNFFLKDVGDLQGELKEAKDSGASEVIVSAIGESILDTKYREDKHNRVKANIINDLDPLPGKTLKEVIDIFKNGGIDKTNFVIKSNLINFVRRFERENIDIVKFGSLINYQRKIEQINDSFLEYAQEMSEPKIKEDEII
ncbi:hypothetical protein KAR91_14425 [Candidatus Pacearchaeota archaeon]|nr:hypothetical protein [Candidatus Pacearchaeota archaeon]